VSNRGTIAIIERRLQGIRLWLRHEAPYVAIDQKHLDAASHERAYWHHGYQAALTDIIALIGASPRKCDTVGKPN